MRLLIAIVLLLITSYCFAQKQNVYYLKNDGRYVHNRDSADYIRLVREPDSASVLYNVLDFYKNGGRKLIGKSSSIEPVRFEGERTLFYPDGKKQEIATFKSGTTLGIEYDFYPNGKIYQVKENTNSGNVDNYFLRNDLIKEANDSLGNAEVVNGNGHFKGFDEHFQYINEEGDVKNSKRDGIWNGERRNIKIKFTENWADGNLISGTSTDSTGTVATYKKARSVVPRFKGGVQAFGKYLSDNIQYPANARQRNIQGRVIVSFVVDKSGKTNNIKLVNLLMTNWIRKR